MAQLSRTRYLRRAPRTPDAFFPPVSATEIISYEPATGAELWRGKLGDVDETVEPEMINATVAEAVGK